MRVFIFILSAWLILSSYFPEKADGLTCFYYPSKKHHNGICQTGPGGKCFKIKRVRKDGRHYEETGCIPPGFEMPFMCKANSVPSIQPSSVLCCDDEDLCNGDLDPPVHLAKVAKKPSTDAPSPDSIGVDGKVPITIVIVMSVLMVAMFVVIMFLIRPRLKCRHSEQPRESGGEGEEEGLRVEIAREDFPIRPIGDSCRARAEGRIAFELPLFGSRQPGKLWKAKYQGREVAVKLFQEYEGRRWSREVELYRTPLRHDNILAFLGAETEGEGRNVRFFLITEYHENGSLRNHLGRCPVDPASLARMAAGLLGGLAYLHERVGGNPGKPSVIHRNMTSEVIFVRKDLTCRIGNFGLALSETDAGGGHEPSRLGDPRYAAPEVLEAPDVSDLESLKRADIYSTSLVLWEMLRRCAIRGPPSEYRLPYFHEMGDDPTPEGMKRVVCLGRVRPEISQEWLEDPMLRPLVKAVTASWDADPRLRPSASELGRIFRRPAAAPEHPLPSA